MKLKKKNKKKTIIVNDIQNFVKENGLQKREMKMEKEFEDK